MPSTGPSAYPRLVTKAYLKDLFGGQDKPRLRVIGDISCDVEGAIECTVKATEPGDPIYVYDPLTGQATDGHEGTGRGGHGRGHPAQRAAPRSIR